MASYFTYIMIGLCVASVVLYETWCEYRKLDTYDPAKNEVVYVGVGFALLYGLIWPSALVFFFLGKLFSHNRN